MSISAVEYLRHILDETDFLVRRLSGVSKEDFAVPDLSLSVRRIIEQESVPKPLR